MRGWESFFVAQVGASAAFAGLVFVGVSINLTMIVGLARLVGYALEALIVLLNVLLISSILLVPEVEPSQLGRAVLVVALGAWVLISGQQWRGTRNLERQYWLPYLAMAVLGQAATIPFVLAGFALVGYGPGGLLWIPLGVICSFGYAFYLAWTLLIEINR